MGIEPGTVIGDRYEIVAPLGRGGMGSVFRARHRTLGADVALKVLGTHEHDGEARFEREARALAKLDHPGCVRVIDYGRSHKRRFLVMSLVDGRTAGQLLAAEGPLSTARAVRLVRQLAAALVHAHGRGVLHRDLKPDNVMVTPPGDGPERAVLIDFGLAHLSDDAPLTGRGMCIGSPSYLAPERLGGAPHDPRADLYALGVVLYELIAGAKPFTGDSIAELLHHCRTRPARPLRAIRDDVSPQLEAVVVRALAKDPARRFQTAEDLLAALDDVPVLEQLAVAAVRAAREESETTMLDVPLAADRPSIATRIWARLRFGRWRWRSV